MPLVGLGLGRLRARLRRGGLWGRQVQPSPGPTGESQFSANLNRLVPLDHSRLRGEGSIPVPLPPPFVRSCTPEYDSPRFRSLEDSDWRIGCEMSNDRLVRFLDDALDSLKRLYDNGVDGSCYVGSGRPARGMRRDSFIGRASRQSLDLSSRRSLLPRAGFGARSCVGAFRS